MRILITGGAGFIGSNFVYYWLKKHPKDKVRVIDALTYAGNFENLKPIRRKIEFIKADINNRAEVKEAMKGVDAVVHFAAESHVERSIFDPAVFWRTNVGGTLTLLEEADKAKIKRFHHVSCYDTKTRALTKTGLKTYDQIKKGDLVLSLNPQTRRVEWKPVEKVIVQDYRGDMIEIKSRVVDFLVTPNHRMLFQTKKGKDLIYKEAEKLESQAINKLPKYYKWKGKVPKIVGQFGEASKDFMYLLGIFIGDGFTAYQEKKVINKTGLTRQLFLQKARDSLGQFTLVGNIGDQQFTTIRSWRIFLDIPESDGCRKKCEKTLDNLEINWHAHKGKAGEHLYFTSKKYFEIFEDCGKGAKNKKIPRWALDCSPDLLRPLLEGLLDSDGSKGRVFFTSSPKLASQFMELCVKLGLNPNMNKRYTDSSINGRTVRGWSYVVSLGKRWRTVRREIVRRRKYDAKIWCLKVEDNKNFLIERNGKTAFCGNTDEVYGELALDSNERFSEKTPYAPRPDNLYAISKAEADRVVREFTKKTNMHITISNCSNNYGPFQFPEKYIPILITNLIDDYKAPVHGDGLNTRDWIHTEDHAGAVDLILEKGKRGETYLIGAGNDVPNKFIAERVVSLYGKDGDWIKYVPDRHSNDRRYAIDATRITKELGWKPAIPREKFDDGLKDTIGWYKKNEEWWRPLLKRKAPLSNGEKDIFAFITLDREAGKVKFTYKRATGGRVAKQETDLGQRLMKKTDKSNFIKKKLKSRDWFRNTRKGLRDHLFELAKNPTTQGFVEDIAGRADVVGSVKHLKLIKLAHAPEKYGIYGIGAWFQVETDGVKRVEGYYSWAMGPKSGAKLLVLIRHKGKITHLALLKNEKFPVGARVFDLVGGLPRLNESVYEMISRQLKEELGIDGSSSSTYVSEIIGLGRVMSDAGMTNNHPFLYTVIIDVAEKIFPPFNVGETYEGQEGIVLWPIDKLSDLVNKVDDAYFLSALTRITLGEVGNIKL